MTVKYMHKEHASFQVGLKLILKKGDKFLFLIDAVGGHYDFPGGRIDQQELYVELPDIIAREVKEEIGDVKYKLLNPVIQVKRHFKSKNLHIFLTFYEAEYISGDIALSSEHSGYEWIDPKSIKLNSRLFHNPEECRLFLKYFSS